MERSMLLARLQERDTRLQVREQIYRKKLTELAHAYLHNLVVEQKVRGGESEATDHFLYGSKHCRCTRNIYTQTPCF